MPGANFVLSEIVPDVELTFTDDAHGGDGTTYPVLARSDIGAEDFANMRRKLAEMNKNIKVVRTGKGGNVDQATIEMSRAIDEVIQWLIPGMPLERVNALPIRYKAAFVTWWREQQPAATQAEELGEAKAQPSERVPRGKPRSRTSSGRTSSTPASS